MHARVAQQTGRQFRLPSVILHSLQQALILNRNACGIGDGPHLLRRSELI